MFLSMRADGEVGGFNVRAPDNQPISVRTLRRIPFGDLSSVARRQPEMRVVERFIDDHGERAYRTSVEFKRERDAPRPGRRGHPDDYYARLAVAYEQWVSSGEPLRVLAERTFLSVPGVRTALRTARDKGFLTEAPRGRKGGHATDKAWQLLLERQEGQG